jgi:hypothetical protein
MAARPTVAPAPSGPATRPAPSTTIPNYASSVGGPSAQDVDWSRLEQSLRDAVLRELQPMLNDEAARLLRERVQPAIERVLTTVTTELRQSFEARLRESVTRVVAAEIARLRERG